MDIQSQNEDTPASISKLLADHLLMPDIKASSFMCCHRLGRYSEGKTRAILLKFQDLTTKDKIWFAKTKLKGSGITLSEFLTKGRHEAFLVARQRFGITNCWTKNGAVIVLGSDGSKHRLFSVTELDTIPCAVTSLPESTVPGTNQINAPHKINGKQLDVKKALPKDGSEQRGGRGGGSGRNDNWGNGGGYGNNQGGWNNSNPWDNNQGGWGGSQGGGGGGGYGGGGGGNQRGGWGNQDFGNYNQQGYSGGPTRNQQYSNSRSTPYNVNQGGGGGGSGGGGGYGGGNYGGGGGGGNQGRGGRF